MAGNDLPPRWTRLWKLHGSLGWKASDKDEVIHTGNEVATHLVFPEHLKYDQTQKAPYAALFDRLRAFLTTPDTLLISIGFSYADAHISARIDEGLAANPSASVFAFQYKPLAEEGAACDLARRRPNLSVYAPDKAVINGIEGPWQVSTELPSKDWGPIRATYWSSPKTGTPPQFTLGAIEAFGRFFAGSRSMQALTPTPAFAAPPPAGSAAGATPYWAIDTTELLSFLMGRLEDRAFTAITDRIVTAKLALASSGKYEGIDVNSLTVDTPLPFSLKQMWFDLIDPELKTWKENTQINSAIEAAGDAEKLIAPRYPLPGPGGATPFANKTGVLSIRRQLDQMRSRLLDRQYDFMLHPGDWESSLTGAAKKDLPELLEGWLGTDKPISILDLSGVPSTVLHHLVGGILNILYEALFWGREAPEGGRQRPLLVVMESLSRAGMGQGGGGGPACAGARAGEEGRHAGFVRSRHTPAYRAHQPDQAQQ